MRTKTPKTTLLGRVVYNRGPHKFSLKDVVRILESLSNTMTHMDKEKNPFIINALYEIVRTAFYPVWLRAQHPGIVAEKDESERLIDGMENRLRQIWQQQTFGLCREIGDAMGIPVYIQDFVINYLGGLIWDAVWKLTDGIFQ